MCVSIYIYIYVYVYNETRETDRDNDARSKADVKGCLGSTSRIVMKFQFEGRPSGTIRQPWSRRAETNVAAVSDAGKEAAQRVACLEFEQPQFMPMCFSLESGFYWYWLFLGLYNILINYLLLYTLLNGRSE